MCLTIGCLTKSEGQWWLMCFNETLSNVADFWDVFSDVFGAHDLRSAYERVSVFAFWSDNHKRKQNPDSPTQRASSLTPSNRRNFFLCFGSIEILRDWPTKWGEVQDLLTMLGFTKIQGCLCWCPTCLNVCCLLQAWILFDYLTMFDWYGIILVNAYHLPSQ